MEKRTVRGVAVLGVVCLLGLGGPRGLAPGVAAQSQKQEPNNGWAYVNCDKGPSGALQRAIDRATSGQTIHVSGTCYENVTIPAGKDLLTLDGGGEATIDGPDDTANTILVRGPRGVTITRLTITGGRVGIDVSRGSSALIDSNTIEGTGRNGIILGAFSTANIVNKTIQNNPVNGILVTGNAFGFIAFAPPTTRSRVPTVFGTMASTESM